MPDTFAGPGHGMRLPSGRELARALAAFFRRLYADLAARLRHGIPARAPTLAEWVKPLAELVRPLLLPYYRAGGTQAARRIARLRRGKALRKDAARPGVQAGFDVFRPEVLVAVEQASLDLARSTLATSAFELGETLARLREALGLGLPRGEALPTLTRRLMAIFADPRRAAAVAQTEASRAMHGGQLLAAKESGVVEGKRWLASADACERCLQLAAKGVVGLDEPFQVEARGGPYAVVMTPPGHPHCMCSMTEVL